MKNLHLFSGSADTLLDQAALVFFGIAVLIFFYHEIRVLMVKNEQQKYDYVSTHEIRYFWYAVMALVVALALALDSVVAPLFSADASLRIYIRIFFLAGFIVICYLLLAGVVRFLYPRVIERRLKRIRNKPRVSPAGNVMRKLTEEEELVHLEQSQIDEQASDIHSVEYDVWIDDKTGYKKVEKYMANEHAEKCKECGFYTMKINSEEIEKKPSQTEDGMLIKHFKCSYCKHREAREVVIAKFSSNA
jgi:hypothetical protein